MTVFDQAWGVMKDIDYDVLTDVALGRKGDYSHIDRDSAKEMLMRVMSDPSNLPLDSDASKPRLFRSMPQSEHSILSVGDRNPQRYFTPQRLAAQQYSEYWRDRTQPRRVGEFEMPVPLNDKSVLTFHPGEYRGWGATEDWITDEEKERLAQGSGLSVEDALDRLELAHGAYIGSPGLVNADKRAKFNEMLQNAGYDYIRHNELSSQELNPPIFTRIGWKTPRSGADPAVIDLADEITSKFGYKYPYKSVWHVGDEESAPKLLSVDEKTGSRGRTSTDDLLDLLFGGRIDDVYGGIYGYGE